MLSSFSRCKLALQGDYTHQKTQSALQAAGSPEEALPPADLDGQVTRDSLSERAHPYRPDTLPKTVYLGLIRQLHPLAETQCQLLFKK